MRALSLALPGSLEVDTADAIRSLEMGFLPIRSLVSKSGATFLHPKEPDFRLDFLTARHRGRDEPLFHPQLGVMLQPLPVHGTLARACGTGRRFLARTPGADATHTPHPRRAQTRVQ